MPDKNAHDLKIVGAELKLVIERCLNNDIDPVTVYLALFAMGLKMRKKLIQEGKQNIEWFTKAEGIIVKSSKIEDILTDVGL
jgi:hypothetical protein